MGSSAFSVASYDSVHVFKSIFDDFHIFLSGSNRTGSAYTVKYLKTCQIIKKYRKYSDITVLCDETPHKSGTKYLKRIPVLFRSFLRVSQSIPGGFMTRKSVETKSWHFWDCWTLKYVLVRIMGHFGGQKESRKSGTYVTYDFKTE